MPPAATVLGGKGFLISPGLVFSLSDGSLHTTSFFSFCFCSNVGCCCSLDVVAISEVPLQLSDDNRSRSSECVCLIRRGLGYSDALAYTRPTVVFVP